VLDGCSLLHHLPWNKGDSCGTIAESYAEFTVRNSQGPPLRIPSIRGGGKLASSH
jgi:hypothetical protein